VLITLPMFGDYYTPNIVSSSPTTSMIGNQIDLYFHSGPQPTIGAALTIVLAAFLTLLMLYYMWSIHRAQREVGAVGALGPRSPSPGRRPGPRPSRDLAPGSRTP